MLSWNYDLCVMCGKCLVRCKESCGRQYCGFDLTPTDPGSQLFCWTHSCRVCMSQSLADPVQYSIWETPASADVPPPCVQACPRGALRSGEE